MTRQGRARVRPARRRAASSLHPPANLNPENTMSTKSQTADDTHQELKSLLHEAEKALSETAGDAGEKFDELRERLRSALDRGRFSFENIRSETVRRAKQ